MEELFVYLDFKMIIHGVLFLASLISMYRAYKFEHSDLPKVGLATDGIYLFVSSRCCLGGVVSMFGTLWIVISNIV